jgi:hypothetical protein
MCHAKFGAGSRSTWIPRFSSCASIMEASSVASAVGRIMPKVRQAVAGRPITTGREPCRHSAGESTATPLPTATFFQSFHESSESGRRKLAALADIGKVKSQRSTVEDRIAMLARFIVTSIEYLKSLIMI